MLTSYPPAKYLQQTDIGIKWQSSNQSGSGQKNWEYARCFRQELSPNSFRQCPHVTEADNSDKTECVGESQSVPTSYPHSLQPGRRYLRGAGTRPRLPSADAHLILGSDGFADFHFHSHTNAFPWHKVNQMPSCPVIWLMQLSNCQSLCYQYEFKIAQILLHVSTQYHFQFSKRIYLNFCLSTRCFSLTCWNHPSVMHGSLHPSLKQQSPNP